MQVLLIGATGDVGSAVADALSFHHDVLKASRHAQDSSLRVDISSPDSIRALFEHVGLVDAIVCCAGSARPGPITSLTDEDFAFTLANKVMGQVNVVRLGVDHLRDNGAFVLTTGIYGAHPPPGFSAFALANGAIESFTRGAALDLPRGIRLNAICPPLLHETAQRMGLRGSISAKHNAEFYVRVVEGRQTGQIVHPG